MYFFTDWVLDKNGQPDKDVQYNYGIMMNCFITYYIYVNVFVILYYTLSSYWLGSVKYYRVFRFELCGFGSSRQRPVEAPRNQKDKLSRVMRKFNK